MRRVVAAICKVRSVYMYSGVCPKSSCVLSNKLKRFTYSLVHHVLLSVTYLLQYFTNF